jgi:hypothetical protein
MIGTALEEVVPSPAPVAAVIRRGKRVRIRRRAVVGAGLAAVAIAAVFGPGLVRDVRGSAPPSVVKQPQVTVSPVGRANRHGVIANGAINGRPWTIRLRKMGKDLCLGASGGPSMGCQRSRDFSPGEAPVTFEGAGGGDRYYLAGPVSARVSRVSVVLSDGAVLRLEPVRFGSLRWVGVMLPTRVGLAEVIAYSAGREIAHAIPFQGTHGAMPSIVGWLRPGQRGLARISKLVGSGVSAGRHWSVTMHAGPWGYCTIVRVAGRGASQGCWPSASVVGGVRMSSSGGPVAGSPLPWWSVGQVPRSVTYLTFVISDGHTVRVPAVPVGRERIYSLVLGAKGLRVLRWAAHDAAGHTISSGVGLPNG